MLYRLPWYQRASVNRGVTSVSGPHRHDVIVGRSSDDVTTSHVTLSRAVHRSRPASPPECTANFLGLLELDSLSMSKIRVYEFPLQVIAFPVTLKLFVRNHHN